MLSKARQSCAQAPCKPRFSRSLDKGKTTLSITCKELTLIYQPRARLDQIKHKQTSGDLVKTNYLLALHTSDLHFSADLRAELTFKLAQVKFLKENNPLNLVNWVNYYKDEAQLSKLGCVDLITLQEFQLCRAEGSLALETQLLAVAMCADTQA